MSDDELIETQRFLMKLLWSVHKDWLSAEQKWTLGGLSDFITRYGVNERGLRLNKHQLLKR